ncbi:hypothetical protein DIURU_002465 [Diutina rugosa]|uniref:CID domain-containing protein n=1 Tax=Diutina rugosa TaxID=5481 RepID=A0A642UQ07_DIURU|nr:uncharacterized protein DIURU_002465 [Diutina rugosa]KAA8903303.1 hypothetical protein DIURU_002465 [Diutina rugosa]
MSFSADGFSRKLEALQETQDSIVKLSQWVLFHHRNLRDIARMWAAFVEKQPRGSSRKQLTLLYLCNDVVQQAKRKRKQEFVDEFASVLPTVFQRVYARLDSPTQGKVDRLISVWQDRVVFDSAQIASFKQAIKQSVSAQPSAAAGPPATAAGSTKLVPELNHLNDLFGQLNKVNTTAQGNLAQFNVQSKQYLPGEDAPNAPSPKVWISKLNTLEKLGEMATTAIKDQQRLKQQIRSQLALMLKTLEEGVSKDDDKLADIASKLQTLDETRQELKQMNSDTDDHKPRPLPTKPSSSSSASASASASADEEDDALPTYEKDSDDDDDDDDDNDNTTNTTGGPASAASTATAAASALATAAPAPGADGESAVAEPESPAFSTAPLSPGGGSDTEGENGSRKRRLSQTPSGGSTPSHKKVAFSEDIEVKEFDQDDGNSDDHADAHDDANADDGQGAGADIMSLLMKLN